jgi:5-methylcytosine-specific restriction endonuclease McrA
MPFKKENYPENWKDIVAVIKQRAGDCCELCNAPNKALVQRIKGAEYSWYKVTNAEYSWKRLANATDGVIQIVLTVHHIDFDTKNNAPYNLILLCQRCHNKLDMPLRIKNRKRKKEQEKISNDIK